MKKNILAYLTILGASFVPVLSSCDSMIYDDEGDCSVHYRLPFSFTTNILNADAFASQVSRVTLYIYDEEGNLVMTRSAEGEILKEPGYAMELDLTPGKYSALAWCTGEASYDPSISFKIGGGADPVDITEITATLPLKNDETGLYADNDIVPLFHGYIPELDLPDTYGDVTLPVMNLVKDTNIINVVLENLEGTPIAPDALTVSIEASNSEMNWDNTLTGERQFSYRPWSITRLSSVEEDTRAEISNPMTGLLTESTVGRLMTDRKPMLVVYRKWDDKEIIRLDLIKYLCLVKGHYNRNYTDQEYLDRMDYHTITFFVDADLNWYVAGGININGWKVVPDQIMEL